MKKQNKTEIGSLKTKGGGGQKIVAFDIFQVIFKSYNRREWVDKSS